MKVQLKTKKLQRRKQGIRNKISGTSERPRLSVYRSLSHIYAQLIDDVNGTTIIAASSRDKEISDAVSNADSKIERSKITGKLLAERAQSKGVTEVVFDRNGKLYHGRVKALAESAREGGLSF